MWLIIILILIIAFCGLGVFYLFFKKLPDIKNLNINSLTEVKQLETKAKILQAKLMRDSSEVRKKMGVFFGKEKNIFYSWLHKTKAKAQKLEAQYAKEKTEPEELFTKEELLEEGESLLKKDDFVAAEKKLIEVISLDKKNVEAYEMLGELYFENKNYDQAEEIYKYLIKLSTIDYGALSENANFKNGAMLEAETDFLSSLEVDNKIAVYYSDLAEVYEVTDKDDNAIDCYLKASSIEPNNPKYLDKIIDLAIQLEDRGLAKKTFNRLREINPENGKLEELRVAIEKL
ncbi:MAG: tetratricopeptide repeat protein [bacterium]